MADKKTDTVDPAVTEAVEFYLANSEIASNGVRKIPKGVFMQRLGKNGVDEETLKTVQDAVDFETTAAAHVALHDLEEVIKSTDKNKLKDEEFRRGLSSTVRLPTFGGSTEVTVNAESVSQIPARGDQERSTVTVHGRTRTSIQAKGRIDPAFHEMAREKLRKSLGIK